MGAALGIDTKIILLAAGLIFLLALVLGVWKYQQSMVSDDRRAHPYVDIAHRAALLYSFATLLIAVFVQLSAWPPLVNLTAALVVLFFFVGAIFTDIGHGARRDTVNQFEHVTCGARLRRACSQRAGLAVTCGARLRRACSHRAGTLNSWTR